MSSLDMAEAIKMLANEKNISVDTLLQVLVDALATAYKRRPGAAAEVEVSVNPDNRGVGYHVDWAAGFPYQRLGLPVNYLTPLPAITLFGFRFDETYSNAASDELQDGISAGETVLRQDAAQRKQSPAAYRRMLQARFPQVVDPYRNEKEH